jgi:arabinogalactan endo-1,4-beta-galactosidase|tara:strand:+ start:785 stop:1165 length:381 start_codon:yes stop_codon:yes gene_type:complete
LKNNNDLRLKNELDTVYIDSSGKKHLDYMEALCAETQIQMCRESKLQQKQKIMDIIELVMQVLKSENWGVFYKNQPIQPLEMRDGNALYKVNQVDECEIETAIEQALTKWKSSQNDSNQNKNFKTG